MILNKDLYETFDYWFCFSLRYKLMDTSKTKAEPGLYV